MTRFSLNQITGPETNPDQIALDHSFAVRFFDHQRNASVKYLRTISPRLSFETAIGYDRSTPFFPAGNHVQPGIGFGDGLFEGFNTPAGSIFGSFGNLYQFKHDMIFAGKDHTLKWAWNYVITATPPSSAPHPTERIRSEEARIFAGSHRLCEWTAQYSARRSLAGFTARASDWDAVLL